MKDKMIMVPFQGVGDIQFGMTRKDIESILVPCRKVRYLKELDLYVAHYSLFKTHRCTSFVIEFKDNKVDGITLYDNLSEYHHLSVLLCNVDLFKEKAENVIDKLRSYSICYYDAEDKNLSTEYVFPEFGITLWREIGFHSQLLKSQEFHDMTPDDQDFMRSNLYFKTITLFRSKEDVDCRLKILGS